MRLLTNKQMGILKNHLEEATGNNIQDMVCPICQKHGFRNFANPLQGIQGVYFQDYKLTGAGDSGSFCVTVVIPCFKCGFMFQFDSNMIFDVEELFENPKKEK